MNEIEVITDRLGRLLDQAERAAPLEPRLIAIESRLNGSGPGETLDARLATLEGSLSRIEAALIRHESRRWQIGIAVAPGALALAASGWLLTQ